MLALKTLANCEYVLHFIDEIHSTDGQYLGIVTELKEADIPSCVQKLENKSFDEENASLIMYQLLSVFKLIHSNGMVYQNTNLFNILISNFESYPSISLTGFSLLSIANPNTQFQHAGNPLYWAPELFRGDPYMFSADIWSSGIVMFYLLTGCVPFNPSSERDVLESQIKRGLTKSDLDKFNMSEEAKDLILQLMNPSWDSRPTATNALKHKWFKNRTPYWEKVLKSLMSEDSWEDF